MVLPAKRLVSAYAIKRPAFILTYKDLMSIKQDPTVRLTATRFGPNADEVVFLGRAADWKGVKGIEAVRAVNPGVAAGLEKAISISKACAGVKGVATILGYEVPAKVLCQIEKAGK